MALQSINIEIDENLMKQAQELFAGMGMDVTTAVNVFLHQAVREQAIPFRIGEPVHKAIALTASAEVGDMKQNPERHANSSDNDRMMEELLSEI